MLRDLGIYKIGTEGLERRKCAFLIGPYQPRVADHVSGHYGGETAFHRYPPDRELSGDRQKNL